jgi:hypothetical protein
MRPIPLRPDPGALVTRNVTGLARAVIATATAKIERRSDASSVLRTLWPGDPIAPLVLRAASQPATLATDTALGQSVVADLVSTIGQVGAGARLLQGGLQLVFDQAATITVPALEASADTVAFIQEGAPVPVRGFTSETAELLPHKLAAIVVLSAEMIASSNAEALVIDALTRSLGLAIDAALFDDAASDPVRPAGLRHGIIALTPSAAGNPDDDMISDLTALAVAVAPIGGPIMFVASPERSVAIGLRARRELPFTVLGSPAVAADDVLAIAVNGLVSAVDAMPEIAASRLATLHMDDVPGPIVHENGDVAAPTRSLFQTDTVGIKFRCNASWALRDPRGLAWLTATGW